MKNDETKSVDSASDDRTVNNSNTMRHNYRVLTDDEKNNMVQIKDMGQNFHNFITEVLEKSGGSEELEKSGGSEELEQAKIKVREAVMWAVNHLTK